MMDLMPKWMFGVGGFVLLTAIVIVYCLVTGTSIGDFFGKIITGSSP